MNKGKLKKYLQDKHVEYHKELKKLDMDDVCYNFLLGQKSGIEEALFFLNYGKDIWEEEKE